MDMLPYFKSVIEQDKSAVVICNTEHIIIYMNLSAKLRYAKRGGEKLVGKSILDCHNSDSTDKIQKTINWFKSDRSHNILYTHHRNRENKDVYIVALRDDNGELIGYYEKHEYRNKETEKTYDFK